MRTYAPAEVDAVLAGLLSEPSMARGVVHHAVLPPRAAAFGEFPSWLDPRIVAGLAGRGIERPYTHQAEAIEAVHAGEDIVVVTPTASGKTLCYALPILQALADDPASRALFLFPTKALGQDQVDRVRRAVAGGRPAGLRVDLRRRHAGADPVGHPERGPGRGRPTRTCCTRRSCPTTPSGSSCSSSCAYIVIDELHTYRGVFGSHVANVLRRLLRICAHYGSNPVIVCCSATIGNPAELAAALTGRPVAASSIGTARRPASATSCWSTRRCSTRRAGRAARPLTLAQRWALPFLRAGRQTIVFGRSRVAVELLLTGLRESLRESRGPRSRGPRLSRRLPADRAAGDRAGAARRRDPRRRRHQRARARRRHRPARRVDPGRLSGLDRRRPGSSSGGRGGGRARASRSSSRPARPVDQYVDPPPGVPARGHARGGARSTRTTSTSCSPTSGRRRSSCRSSRARCSARARRTTCSPSSPRRATSARRATAAGTGRARTSRPRRSRCGPPRRRTS